MVYIYHVKHNSILGSMFTNTKAQLHVSVTYVGHLQVVHEKFINKLYQCVWRVYGLWGEVGYEISFCVGEKGVDRGCLGICVKVTSMSTYCYVYKWVTFEAVLGEDQFGFRRGKGTRDAIGMMRIIAE